MGRSRKGKVEEEGGGSSSLAASSGGATTSAAAPKKDGVQTAYGGIDPDVYELCQYFEIDERRMSCGRHLNNAAVAGKSEPGVEK